jgi:hypothetical protein
MSSRRSVTLIAGLLLPVSFMGSVITRSQVQKIRGHESTLEDVLYLPSGKTLKRLSLGYSSLLADVYWTRAVQYFGAKHIQRSQRYDLLAPLLEITTDLDPHLIVAYETGAIFLCQKRPEGAGEPDKAVALVEKGIRENPAYWRLYFTLGFIHYIDRHDYKAANQAFLKGSEVPGALPWMKVMAARMAEKAEDPTTAAYLWKTIYDTTTDRTIRDTALKHLASLRAQADIEELERRARAYRERYGVFPAAWSDLIDSRLLRDIPRDPSGTAYKLMHGGVVQVEDPSLFPYLERRQEPAK